MAKVALVHDWLTGYRGGEKVLRPIASLFPDSPIHTLFYVPGSVHPDIESHPIHTSFLNNLPRAKSKYRYYLPLFPLAAETLVRGDYDLVVSTSHAVAKSIRTKALHWCYIHSPMRYVWDRFDDYFGPDMVGSLPSNLFFKPICQMLRKYDKATVNRVDHFVANSSFVRRRVQEFYKVDCEVIHPPVDVSRFLKIKRSPDDFYLFFSALVPYKKADHAIHACQRLKRPLKILGKGPELKRLKNISDPKWVEFIEDPTDSQIDQIYSRAQALLFPGVEDFGIVPVEASASGLPVIGFAEGGLLDSQNEETCVFYKSQTVSHLCDAIIQFEQTNFDEEKLRSNALRFSESIFKDKVRSSIQLFSKNHSLDVL